MTRRIIARSLVPDGYELLDVRDGKEGLEMDGFHMLEILGEKDIKTPVIVLTENVQETTREKCFRLGAFAFLNKPLANEELRRMVHRALNLKKESKVEADTQTN